MKNNLIRGFPLICYYLGLFLLAIGFIILIPLITLIFYPSSREFAACFLIPGVISILFGYFVTFFFHGKKPANLENHQDAVLVVLIWILAILISSFPFLLTGRLTFTQAMFEVTSGYTTTGLTVIDVSTWPEIFLFYRSLTLFVGGVGFVLIVTSVISDKLRLNIYEAEGHNDKLLPNLQKSSQLIFTLYFGYILFGTLLYCICGMNFFDALNHSIAALSTGGFSTKVGNIYDFHSVSIEVVSMILMLLGSTNFVIHISLFKGKFKAVLLHCETLFTFFLLVVLTGISSVILTVTKFQTDNNNVLVVLFQLISALTTTGFQNISDINLLPSFFIGIMIVLMLIGGEMGSTAGGIKQYRIITCLKGISHYISSSMKSTKVLHPIKVRKDEQILYLEEKDFISNYAFVFTYLIIFIIGSIIFSSFGYDIEKSMFEFASCLSTVGLSTGIINATSNNVILWTGIIGMFLGRLEIFVVFYSIIKLFTKKNRGFLCRN